jgi:DNA-binding MarR family transcriptional regulator
MSQEQARILHYLRDHSLSSLSDLCRTTNTSPGWVKRVLADLEWLGYIVVYYDRRGEPLSVQTTERGMECLV